MASNVYVLDPFRHLVRKEGRAVGLNARNHRRHVDGHGLWFIVVSVSEFVNATAMLKVRERNPDGVSDEMGTQQSR